MKKTLLLASVVAAMQQASATVTISWDTSLDGGGRIYDTQANAAANGTTGRFLSGQALVLLIWSGDNAINDISTLGGQKVTGGEVILDAELLNATGRYTYLGQTAGNGGVLGGPTTAYSDALAGGYLYTRVFNATTMAAIGVGTTYAEGPTWTIAGSSSPLAGPVQVTTADPLTTAQVDMTPAGGGVSGTGNIFLNKTIAVPEPATFAFLGIGGLLLAIRRFRKS